MVMICSTPPSKRFRQCLGLVVLCVVQNMPVPAWTDELGKTLQKGGAEAPKGGGVFSKAPRKAE